MSKISSIGADPLILALQHRIRGSIHERVLDSLLDAEVAKYRAKLSEVLRPEVEKLTLEDITLYFEHVTLQQQLQVSFDWGSKSPA